MITEHGGTMDKFMVDEKAAISEGQVVAVLSTMSDATKPRTTGVPRSRSCAQRRREAMALGGAEAVGRHHERGRLTIRERVAGLVDKDSFQEVGTLTGQGKYDGADADRRHARRPTSWASPSIDGRAGGGRRRGLHHPRRLELVGRPQEGRPGRLHRGSRRQLSHPAGQPDRRRGRQRHLDQQARPCDLPRRARLRALGRAAGQGAGGLAPCSAPPPAARPGAPSSRTGR